MEEIFPVSETLLKNVRAELTRQEDIFSHASNPLLASLITCLGIQFEMGRPAWDRLSAALGVELKSSDKNPWRTQIISNNGKIGIKMWIPEVSEFCPLHEDFRDLLHPLSLSPAGLLEQIVIFPQLVAERFQRRGLELVVVKDWVTSSFLSHNSESINYLKVNPWEIENNSAYWQSQLLFRGQVAFTGTHDIADHLLGGQGEGLLARASFFREVHGTYQNLFFHDKAVKKNSLLVSYLLGVLLDDMAQPRWYQSERHDRIARKSLELLKEVSSRPSDSKQIVLNKSFDLLMSSIRARSADAEIDQCFSLFASEIT